MFPPRFPVNCLCLLVVLVYVTVVFALPPEPHSSSAPLDSQEISLDQDLGKEYIVTEEAYYHLVLESWNYTDCDVRAQRVAKPVIKLIKVNGEFIFTYILEKPTTKLRLKNVLKNASEEGSESVTKLLFDNGFLISFTNTSDEIKITENIYHSNSTIIFKAREVKDTDNCKSSNYSGAIPSLNCVLGREYVLQHSEHNDETFRNLGYSKCVRDFLKKGTLVVKLNNTGPDEFILSRVFEIDNTRFQLGKPAVDIRGHPTTFTLNGTTLTRVSDFHFGYGPRTVTYKFDGQNLEVQEVVPGSGVTLIFKDKNYAWWDVD